VDGLMPSVDGINCWLAGPFKRVHAASLSLCSYTLPPAPRLVPPHLPNSTWSSGYQGSKEGLHAGLAGCCRTPCQGPVQTRRAGRWSPGNWRF